MQDSQNAPDLPNYSEGNYGKSKGDFNISKENLEKLSYYEQLRFKKYYMQLNDQSKKGELNESSNSSLNASNRKFFAEKINRLENMTRGLKLHDIPDVLNNSIVKSPSKQVGSAEKKGTKDSAQIENEKYDLQQSIVDEENTKKAIQALIEVRGIIPKDLQKKYQSLVERNSELEHELNECKSKIVNLKALEAANKSLVSEKNLAIQHKQSMEKEIIEIREEAQELIQKLEDKCIALSKKLKGLEASSDNINVVKKQYEDSIQSLHEEQDISFKLDEENKQLKQQLTNIMRSLLSIGISQEQLEQIMTSDIDTEVRPIENDLTHSK